MTKAQNRYASAHPFGCLFSLQFEIGHELPVPIGGEDAPEIHLIFLQVIENVTQLQLQIFAVQGSFQFNVGSLLVLGAACCWGLENNCTRMLSSKSSVQITTIKGTFSGLGSLVISLVIGEKIPGILWIGAVLLLGFVAYGLSINFYIKAQKDLGAAKTRAYYSIAPFLGVAFGIILLKERPGLQFYVGLVIMIAATVLMVKYTIGLQHTHEHIHIHTHTHIHTEDEALHDHPYEHEEGLVHNHDHENL